MALVPPSSSGGVTVASIGALFTATGQVLQGTGNGTGAVVLPAGFEIAYDQITAPVAIVSTTEGTPTTIIGGTAHTYEALPYLFSFYAPVITLPSTVSGSSTVLLIQDGASIGRIWAANNEVVAVVGSAGGWGTLRFTPSAGSHTFAIAAFVTATTGAPAVVAGAGGAAAYAPAFIRATKC